MAHPGTEAWAREKYGPPCTQAIIKVYFGKRYVTVSKKAARHFRRLAIIFKWKAPGYLAQIDDFYDDWGFACRKIAGSNAYSNHAFGLAIDIDAVRNGQGTSALKSPIWTQAKEAVLQAEKEGFGWGGRFSNPVPMHFESRLSPTQIGPRYK